MNDRKWIDSGLTESEKEIVRLRSEVEFYTNREKHFAEVLSVCDGGQYRNDWDSRIRELVDSNKQLRAEVEELKKRPTFDREKVRELIDYFEDMIYSNLYGSIYVKWCELKKELGIE